MKTRLTLLATLLFALFISSCKLDPADLDDKRDNITKSWHAVLSDGSVPNEYQIDITKDESQTDKIYFSNFINNSVKGYATISELSITVPKQSLGNSQVSGTGKIQSDYQRITFNLTIDDAAYTLTLTPGTISKITPTK